MEDLIVLERHKKDIDLFCEFLNNLKTIDILPVIFKKTKKFIFTYDCDIVGKKTIVIKPVNLNSARLVVFGNNDMKMKLIDIMIHNVFGTIKVLARSFSNPVTEPIIFREEKDLSNYVIRILSICTSAGIHLEYLKMIKDE